MENVFSIRQEEQRNTQERKNKVLGIPMKFPKKRMLRVCECNNMPQRRNKEKMNKLSKILSNNCYN